ncbi:MAG: transketolase [Spirochaetaceae bacterium]|nr:transketolase [Spirochaetaceae bacterium]
MSASTLLDLKEMTCFAARIRLETLKCVGERGFGHLGGALSIVEALAALYGGLMRIDPANPQWPDRDKLVMSKGHAGPALYAALALKGYFPQDWLATLNQPGTRLPSHCDRKLTPGIDMTTGSLGQGVSTAIGLALAQRMDGKDSRTYLITGDGELNEGQTWEGALFAPQHRLTNLTWLVDYNRKQLDGETKDVLDLGDLEAKFRAFGWATRAVNGNDLAQVVKALEAARQETVKPFCIVLNTVKGAGVPGVASIALNHHIVFDGELRAKAIAAMEAEVAALEGATT